MPDDNVIGPRVRAVENMVNRSRAQTRRGGVGVCKTCNMQLWLSFFFDGTGNNRHSDFPLSHSNVAALFQAHEEDRDAGIVPFYYEGLGTDFEFRERVERKFAYVKGRGKIEYEVAGYKEDEWLEHKTGLGFAVGIDIRLEKAMYQLEDSIEMYRRARRVDEINLAAFGFSRGATEARAFMHWIAEHSKVCRSGNKLRYDGIPLNIKFLGIFDTVESVGGAGKNKQPTLIKTGVPAFVEKCFHSTAAHELRKAFPLTVLGTNRYVQAIVPGAHADVGGGYGTTDQGRSNKLSRYHLLQMLDHARGAGLKLKSVAEMKASKSWHHLYRHSFDVPDAVHKAYANYMRHVATPTGRYRDVLDAHMRLYWQWIDSGLAMEDAGQKIDSMRKNGASRDAQGQIITMRHLLRHLGRTPEGRTGNVAGPQSRPPAAVEHFFESLVHDSFEHFSATGGTLQTDLSIADYYGIREVLTPQA